VHGEDGGPRAGQLERLDQLLRRAAVLVGIVLAEVGVGVGELEVRERFAYALEEGESEVVAEQVAKTRRPA
jgi:hypothetical protein